MFITTFAQNYSQNAGNAISKTQKFFKSRGGNRMPPDPQRNARLQAKIISQLAIPKLMSGLGTSVKKCPNSKSLLF